MTTFLIYTKPNNATCRYLGSRDVTFNMTSTVMYCITQRVRNVIHTFKAKAVNQILICSIYIYDLILTQAKLLCILYNMIRFGFMQAMGSCNKTYSTLGEKQGAPQRTAMTCEIRQR